jgi:hypothetical protein
MSEAKTRGIAAETRVAVCPDIRFDKIEECL